MLFGGGLIAAVAVRYTLVGIDAGVPSREGASA
jgi:hypothetical protein